MPLRGLVPVVDAVQLLVHREELAHLKLPLRFDRVGCVFVVHIRKRACHLTGPCLVPRRVQKPVQNRLVLVLKGLVVLLLLVRRDLTVEVAHHSFDWGARAQREPVGVFSVQKRWQRVWLLEASEAARGIEALADGRVGNSAIT